MVLLMIFSFVPQEAPVAAEDVTMIAFPKSCSRRVNAAFVKASPSSSQNGSTMESK